MKEIKFALAMLSATATTGCTQVTDIAKKFTAGNTASDTAPYIYLATYKHDNSLTLCISNAEDALRNNGFTENSGSHTEDTFGTVHADNPKGLVAAKIECDTNIGTIAFAVSSLNNDAAFDSFKRLRDAQW